MNDLPRCCSHCFMLYSDVSFCVAASLPFG